MADGGIPAGEAGGVPRRIVAAAGPHTGEFVDRGAPPDIPVGAGFRTWMIWGGDRRPSPVEPGTDALSSFVPPPGGYRVTVTDIMPGGREQIAAGMHRTETIDFAFVLAGPLVLIEDSGEERELASGDCVVQLGTRHSWHNPGSDPARIATVLIGLTDDSEEIHSVF